VKRLAADHKPAFLAKRDFWPEAAYGTRAAAFKGHPSLKSRAFERLSLLCMGLGAGAGPQIHFAINTYEMK
jgi:hypothetical protein